MLLICIGENFRTDTSEFAFTNAIFDTLLQVDQDNYTGRNTDL